MNNGNNDINRNNWWTTAWHLPEPAIATAGHLGCWKSQLGKCCKSCSHPKTRQKCRLCNVWSQFRSNNQQDNRCSWLPQCSCCCRCQQGTSNILKSQRWRKTVQGDTEYNPWLRLGYIFQLRNKYRLLIVPSYVFQLGRWNIQKQQPH